MGYGIRYISALFAIFFILSFSFPLLGGEGVTPATMENYKKVKELVEKLPQTKAVKYAKEIIESANKSIAKAQEGLKAGDERITKQAVELAGVQVTLANVLSDERESAERTEAVRKELTREEARLANILEGKGDSK